MKNIDVNDFLARPVDIWLNKWFLLTAGDFQNHNTMTVAWGSIGGMWSKPFVQVVVRPHRYTYKYMEEYQTFTLCAFSEKFQKKLSLLGSKSGRDGDKIAESGLTLIQSESVEAPSFAEAELIIECRKIYWQDMEPENFLQEEINDKYPQKDYHRIYFGEILNILQA
jgi:flavin reductase (DIM6/NTAB) family NADH-FMN oxidoreductase RutF